REFVASTVAGVLQVCHALRAQSGTVTPDLAAMAERKRYILINRSASPLSDDNRRGVRISEAEGEGVAFLPDINFSTGTIEVDVRGKDVPQHSFVGIAFHRADDKTFDAIYFRPFNFRAADPVGRSHSVQYHSLPIYTWDKLRSEHPGKYEHAVTPPPDPNAWFHVRLVV